MVSIPKHDEVASLQQFLITALFEALGVFCLLSLLMNAESQVMKHTKQGVIFWIDVLKLEIVCEYILWDLVKGGLNPRP